MFHEYEGSGNIDYEMLSSHGYLVVEFFSASGLPSSASQYETVVSTIASHNYPPH